MLCCFDVGEFGDDDVVVWRWFVFEYFECWRDCFVVVIDFGVEVGLC